MNSPRSPHYLPAHLRPLFWDQKFSHLTWQTDRDLIVGRILSQGNWDAVQWLRQQLSTKSLREWLERRRGAGLSPRQLRFWELLLDLPHRTVNAWLADPARQVWEQRRHG
jgi:hypothetical protein